LKTPRSEQRTFKKPKDSNVARWEPYTPTYKERKSRRVDLSGKMESEVTELMDHRLHIVDGDEGVDESESNDSISHPLTYGKRIRGNVRVRRMV